MMCALKPTCHYGWRLSSLALLLLLLSLGAGAATVRAQAPTASPLPPPTGYVNDFASVIDPAAKDRMETVLKNLNERADIQFAVVTVRTTGAQDIFDYSLAVARGWGIGSREGEKKGLLLLVAVDDRKYYIQVSRHLEGDLPDGYVGEVGRRMRDPFRAGNYGEGLFAAVQTIVATLGQKRGFSIEGIDQERYALRERQNTERRPQQRSSISACTVIFIIIVVLVLILSSRGRGGGGGGSGCLNLLLLNALLNSGNRSSGWGGGWSGGSGSGWGGGGGGGGFGGFGGGGDFGGGGSGGSW